MYPMDPLGRPSPAAAVSLIQWTLISKYWACVRTQSQKVEMINNLLNPVTPFSEELLQLKRFYVSRCEIINCID
ncbi:unnamed protein product [Brassica oleracea]|uniref:(rape) hypothetical protein n=1 Tax=Brassica napus TaxID=3708 RepID=A0A816JQ98_BRANA|nr:unnamed protein product [Brassica napus]